ncbi:hypothetical protein IQ250_02640 [Pseudanabaenaceae cyanobacterium LEGE 13415]|nr:hypothetical protein [Pseudanabaenaceae cyanobacterium LEGE 13415]
MRDQLQQRLQALKTEYTSGQQMLADLEAKQVSLRETLLRISGAMQVLQELLDEEPEIVENSNDYSHQNSQSETLIP